jgi:protein-L-isoaspartate(D-aspartate) O-methyltransferase
VERLRRVVTTAILLAAASPAAAQAEGDAYAEARRRMVDAVARMVRDTARETGRASLAPAVMDAMGRVPRHRFVPPELARRAYENNPLPIGQGQTISQPYIVAVMTDLIEPAPGCRALEIGTGSGYQAAVLSLLCNEVYTIEIVEPLGRQARERLARLGYGNVRVRIGDGYYGWPDAAPFDVIVVTAVAGHVPPPLLKQLKPGGRMVLPVGTRFTTQQLVLVSKLSDGRVRTRQLLPVAFVPLTGGHD